MACPVLATWDDIIKAIHEVSQEYFDKLDGSAGTGTGTALDPVRIETQKNPAKVAQAVEEKKGVVDVGSGVRASHDSHPKKNDRTSISEVGKESEKPPSYPAMVKDLGGVDVGTMFKQILRGEDVNLPPEKKAKLGVLFVTMFGMEPTHPKKSGGHKRDLAYALMAGQLLDDKSVTLASLFNKEGLNMVSSSGGPVVFLLGPRTSHADFERFAQANGLVLHEAQPSTREKDAYEQIWVTQDRSTAIHYMDDPTPKERFLVVYGRHTGAVSFDLGTNLDIQASDDVLARALHVSTDPERIDCAWQIGVVTKVYDETALDILKSLYDGANEGVRHAVINAVGYRGWPEARDFLEQVAKEDPSPELRENARAIVDAWWGDEDSTSVTTEGN